MSERKFKAVDFFCSGGGMSIGLQMAGINVLGGIDIDENCRETYTTNIKAPFLKKDIALMKLIELESFIGIKKNDDDLIFVGCSPCQYWSIMRTNKQKAESSKNLLHDFLRFIEYYKPGFIIVENVPGILRKREESGLGIFLETIDKLGYKCDYNVLNLSKYDVPQARKRFSLLASRTNSEIKLPQAKNRLKTVRSAIGNLSKFPPIPSGHKDYSDFMHTTAGLSTKNLQRLNLTPLDGGTREAWASTELQLNTYKNIKLGFKDTYSRMFWDKPSPTITTKFFSISNGRFAHPEQNRPISLREGANLQTFPEDFVFKARSIAAVSRLIGNAVPPLYAKQLGESIKKN